MKLAAQWYVQGGQMGGNVAAAAVRRPGSKTLHVSGWGSVGGGLAVALDVGELAELAAWSAASPWAGGHGRAVRLLLPGGLEASGRASSGGWKLYQVCRRS